MKRNIYFNENNSERVFIEVEKGAFMVILC